MDKQTPSTEFEAVVSRYFPGAALVAVDKLIGGVSADVYRLDVTKDGESTAVVVRLQGETLGGHETAVEFELLQVLHRAGVPVAEPPALDTGARGDRLF